MAQGSEIRQPTKLSVYNEFILWCAMPPSEQVRLGIETQEQFAEVYKLGSNNTCTRWKRRPDFRARVKAITDEWTFDRRPAILEAIYRSARKGNSDSQRIWLQYVEGWSEKTTIENTKKVELSVNDIRFIIEGMPEPSRSKCYEHLRAIIDEGVALRNAGKLEDGYLPEAGSPDFVWEQADHDAQNASHPAANEVAESDTRRIRRNLVGPVSAYHHQSA